MLRPYLLVQALSALIVVSAACGSEPGMPLGASEQLGQGAHATAPARFALLVRLPVSWPQNTGLEAGQGHIEHRLLVTRAASGGDVVRLCGTQTPGYTTRAFMGGEHYAFALAAEAFELDAPMTQVVLERGEDAEALPLRLAVSLGVRLDNPLHDAWPQPKELAELALGQDEQTLGVGLWPTGTKPPVNRVRTRRAQRFDVAMRHAIAVEIGEPQGARRRGTASAMMAHGRALIDSTTLGCQIEQAQGAEAACSRVELYLANAFAPALRPQAGEAQWIALDDETGCKEILDLSF